jgi:Tol biopolymer transport system component
VPPPAGSRFASDVERTYLSLSPDGSQLAFIARDGNNQAQVWLRPLSALDAHPVAGTEGARSVFWAPDSRSFAFFAGSKLKRSDTSGGSVVSVCDAPEGIGLFGTWGADGQILFASVEGSAIVRVSTAGGSPVPEITRDVSHGEARVHWPWFLPDGKRFLYVSRLKNGSGQIMLAELGKAPRPLVSAVYNPQWLDPDILIFVRDGTLVGQRIDLTQARAIGEPFSIAGPIDHSFSTGRAMFTASRTGVLGYQSHTDLDRLVWVDRAGHALGVIGVDGGYQAVRLSSDGRTVLLDRINPQTGTPDVWTFDLDRNVETRLTSDPLSESFPVWLPQGRGIVFMADRGGPPHLFRKDTATGADDQLLPPGRLQQPHDVSAAGDILFTERTERGNNDVRMLHLGDGSVSDVFDSQFDEQQPRLSPDNRAIAVVSDESGRNELYMASFPPKGAKVRVSAGGASVARWAPDGRELFYLATDGRVMAVPVRTQPALEMGAPMPLFALNPAAIWKDFEVARDGKKFIAIIPQSRANEQPLSVIVNWTAGSAAK